MRLEAAIRGDLQKIMKQEAAAAEKAVTLGVKGDRVGAARLALDFLLKLDQWGWRDEREDRGADC